MPGLAKSVGYPRARPVLRMAIAGLASQRHCTGLPGRLLTAFSLTPQDLGC